MYLFIKSGFENEIILVRRNLMAVKINLSIIRKNHAADPEKGFLAKSISMSNGCASAMPTAWELGSNSPFCRFKQSAHWQILKMAPSVRTPLVNTKKHMLNSVLLIKNSSVYHLSLNTEPPILNSCFYTRL